MTLGPLIAGLMATGWISLSLRLIATLTNRTMVTQDELAHRQVY